MDNNTMYKLSYGLFILTAAEGGRDNGCIVNTVTQVTSSPNRITVAVNKQNLTHDMIRDTGEFNVTILSQKSSFDTFKHWGFASGHNVDKMEHIDFCRSENGLIYLPGEAVGFLSGKVVSSIDLGTHTLFLADVTDASILSEDEPMTYDFYQKKVKPAPAPKKKGFICTVCGYIYEGDTLPDDFICPVCGHPASDFRPL